MLHHLAMVATEETPSLLKEALISPEQDRLIKERLAAKQEALAAARGVTPQTRSQANVDPSSGRVKNTKVPDWDKTRMSGSAATREYAPGKLPLAEKEIQKAHGTVSNSPAKQLRHNTVGKVKGAWGGRGLLGGKWRNRAAMVGGLGALGLGIKSYLGANKTPQPEAPREYQSQYELPQQYSGYKAGALYSPSAAGVAAPPAPPKVNSPGPGVKSIPAITPGKGLGMGGKNPFSGSSSKSTGLGSGSMGTSSGKTASRGLLKRSDDTIFPLAAGAAGGLGGWALGSKVIAPMLENKASAIAAEILKKQKLLKTIKQVQMGAPLGAAAAGAILLAALAAIKARESERERMSQPQINPYDQTGAGFNPEEQVPYGDTNFY